MNINKYGKALSWITRPKSTETATLENFNPEELRTPFRGAGLVDHGSRVGLAEGEEVTWKDLPAPGTLLQRKLTDTEIRKNPHLVTYLTRNSSRLDLCFELKNFLTSDGDLRTLPCYLAEFGGMDGFFAARLIHN